MLKFSDIAARLKSGMGARSYSEVARILDVDPVKFNVWRSRDSVSKDAIDKIITWCNNTGYNSSYFLYGVGSPNIPGSFSAPAEEGGLIPVVSIAEAGKGIAAEDQGYPAGTAEEYLSRPAGLKDVNAYAVVVEGNSMMPALRPKTRVIVSPNIECQTGDLAVVKLLDDRVLIAELRFNGETVHLKKYNADDIHITKKELIFCHKIVWIRMM